MPRYRRACVTHEFVVEYYDAPERGPIRNLRDVQAREKL